MSTSQAAAESIRPKAKQLRLKVLAFIRGTGEGGATDHEIQAGLGMNPSTQRPRRGELVKAGLVENSGRTRATPSGRQATVWVSRRT